MKVPKQEVQGVDQLVPFGGYFRSIPLPLLLFSITLLILILRRPHSVIHAKFWAEDAAVFYKEQFVSGPSVITHLYAGYLHVVSRCIAAVVSLFSVRLAPTLYYWFSLLIEAACCSVFALKRNRSLLSSDLMRAALCFLLVASFPATELVGNLTNLQWYLAIGAIPLALTNSAGLVIWELPVGLLMGLSAPATIVLVPLIAWRVLKQRSVTFFQAGLLVALAIQTVANRQQNAVHIDHSPLVLQQTLQSTFIGFSNQVMSCALLGQSLAREITARSAGVFGMVVLTVFFVFVLTLLCTASKPVRMRLCGALWLIFGSLALPCFFREDVRSAFTKFTGEITMGVDRYFVIASIVLAYCFVLAIYNWKPNWSEAKKISVLLAIFSVGTISNFLLEEFPDYHWRGYADQIAGWKQAQKRGEHHAPVRAPIDPPGWFFDLPAL